MAYEIGGFELIEFEIPAGKGKTVTLTVPPMDCVTTADVDGINKELEKYLSSENDSDTTDSANGEALPDHKDPTKDAAELLRLQLRYFNPSKAKVEAINALVARQLRQIDQIWARESSITLGESEPSTDESSQTND